MNIGIDISPISSSDSISHSVRGTGFYIKNLVEALKKYHPDDSYVYFIKGDTLPNDLDIVHYPYFEPFFLTLPTFSRYKTVVTVHDLTPFVFPKQFPSGLKGRLKWLIQRAALSKTQAIITDSQCSKRDIIKYARIDSRKIQVVYLAADPVYRKLSHFDSKPIRKLYDLPEKFFLYVGDVTWNKNLPRLVSAVKKTNIPLVMVGKALTAQQSKSDNSWNVDIVEVIKTIEGDEQFIRLGFIPLEELVLIYNAATAFVMPSLYEGFGLPPLQAMAVGTPVLISSAGSLPEICGEAAVVVDPGDEKDITRGIMEILDEQRAATLRAQGLERAKQFSWEKCARETFNVLKGL